MRRFACALVLLVAAAAWSAKPFPVLSPRAPEDFSDYLEWVFDTSLTQKQRQEATRLIQDLEKSRDGFTAEIVADALTARADLGNHSESEREAFRDSVEDELLKTLRSRYRNKPLAKWILETHVQTHKVLAEGPPPLTYQAAEAWVELLSFVLAESGMEAKPEEMTQLRESLPGAFSQMTEDEKRILSDLPLAWAALRKSWPAKKLDEQRLLKEAWKRALVPEKDAGTVIGFEKARSLLTLVPGWL